MSDDISEKYKKFKIRVKIWETNFMEKHKRKPNKNDINGAKSDIRDAYKNYWKLRTKLLENTVTHTNCNDFVQSSHMNSMESIDYRCHKEDIHHASIQKPNNVCLSKGLKKYICTSEQSRSIETSTVISNYEHCSKNESSSTDKSTFSLSQKMFNNSSKRNPRKLPTKSINYFQKESTNVSDGSCDGVQTISSLTQNETSKTVICKPKNTFQQMIECFPQTFCKQKHQNHVNKLDDSGNIVGAVNNGTSVTFNLTQLSSKKSLINSCIKKNIEDNAQDHKESFNHNCSYSCNYDTTNGIEKFCQFLDETLNYDDCLDKSIVHSSNNNDKDLNVDDDNVQLLKINQCKINETFECESDSLYDNNTQNSYSKCCHKYNISESKINNVTHSKKENVNDTHTRVCNNADVKKKTVHLVKKNFVKINLKKKTFTRGSKSFNYSKYKRNQYSQIKKNLKNVEDDLKYNFSNKIDESQLKDNDFILRCQSKKDSKSFKAYIKNNDLFDTKTAHLELKKNLQVHSCKLQKPHSLETPSQYGSVPGKIKSKEDYDIVKKSQLQKMDPIYELEADGSVKDTPLEVWAALKKFGFNTFREGQENAIMRTLSGQSTLLILATGSGKSLCYQLPAYIFAKKKKCITLVVSPLVSLMDDQVSEIPDFLSAACLHSNQSIKMRKDILENLKNGKLNILLVSPETIVAEDRSNNLGILFRELPPIAFACIDEVHCISQWSHSFRPSYLMISKVLKKSLGVNTFLGLTATANSFTTKSIMHTLEIKDEIRGIICHNSLPSNLVLTISKDENKKEALLKLLQCDRFNKNNSIIIYCTRREDCTKLATFLRTIVNNHNSENLNARTFEAVEVYHAGLSASKRKAVQKSFMKSKTKIVVSTVAFGMGINKCDIRSVIHYDMPASLEQYVQEIGRAGRDGLVANCHLFLHSEEKSDLCEIRRHINSKGIDRQTLRYLLGKIFIKCNCFKQIENHVKSCCSGHDIFFSVNETIKTLDITEEMITTLLYYLELHPKKFISVYPCIHVIAEISSDNANALEIAAKFSPLLAVAITLSKENKTFYEASSTAKVYIPDLAYRMGENIEEVLIHLKKLENTPIDCQTHLTEISITYRMWCFRVNAPGDFNDDELDEVLESLHQINSLHLSSCHRQLQYFSRLCREFSCNSVDECLTLNNEIHMQSELLKSNIKKYFETDNILSDSSSSPEKLSESEEKEVIRNIRTLIRSYEDSNFTGRAIARIFHGIQSPNYSAIEWSKSRFWRAHLNINFNLLCQISNREIITVL